MIEFLQERLIMIKDEKNNLIIIDSLGNTNNTTNQSSKFLSIFKQYKDLISILVLVIGAFNAIMSKLLQYSYRMGISNFYKISVDYIPDKSLPLLFTIFISFLLAILMLSITCLYAIIISNSRRRFIIFTLIHVMLLLIIGIYLFNFEANIFNTLIIISLLFIGFHIIYSTAYLLNYKKINKWILEYYVKKNKKLTNEKKCKRKLYILKKINKYYNITKSNVKTRKNRLAVISLVMEFAVFIIVLFFVVKIMGTSNTRQERTYNIILESNMESFNTKEPYHVVISESSDYIYTFECIINTNDNESNLTIYNDVLTSVKKPDTFTQVRVTFNSVEFINRLTEKETTD